MTKRDEPDLREGHELEEGAYAQYVQYLSEQTNSIRRDLQHSFGYGRVRLGRPVADRLSTNPIPAPCPWMQPQHANALLDRLDPLTAIAIGGTVEEVQAGQVLLQSGAPEVDVYFPITAVLSLMSTMASGDSCEVAAGRPRGDGRTRRRSWRIRKSDVLRRANRRHVPPGVCESVRAPRESAIEVVATLSIATRPRG